MYGAILAGGVPFQQQDNFDSWRECWKGVIRMNKCLAGNLDASSQQSDNQGRRQPRPSSRRRRLRPKDNRRALDYVVRVDARLIVREIAPGRRHSAPNDENHLAENLRQRSNDPGRRADRLSGQAFRYKLGNGRLRERRGTAHRHYGDTQDRASKSLVHDCTSPCL